MENLDGESQHVSKSHENFLRDFIKTYRENRILWDQNHPNYKRRDDRDAALEVLLNKTREYISEANLDFVKTKIDSIRGVFRRERKKVLDSKKKAKSDEDIYVPSLWYYNLLLFINGEESDEKLCVKRDISKHIHYSWSKQHTVILIDLLKKYPVLYSLDLVATGSKLKRAKAYRNITNELVLEARIHFEDYEVRNKINTLKQQFRKEYRDRAKRQIKKSPKLWCYDLLMFLKDPTNSKKHEISSEEEQDMSDQETENLWINYEVESDSDKKEHIYQEESQDDIFDTIGKNVAIKLRDMTDDQRLYAENLINEIMYNGLMEKLNAESRIGLAGD